MAPKGKAAPAINPQVLAHDYGFAYSVLNSNPELKAIFEQAISPASGGPWSIDRFLARIESTAWWRHTSDTAREWTMLGSTDPATRNQRLAARINTIRAEARAIGVNVPAQALQNMANSSIMFGWTDQQVRQVLGKQWKYSPNAAQPFGQAATTVNQMKKTAADYLLPVSNDTLYHYAQRTVEGLGTADDFTSYAQQQAKSLFPHWAKEIDQGMTVQQLVDPYRQMAGSTLGIDPNTIDFTQPKWRNLIDKVDPTTGQRAPLSLADAQTELMRNQQFGYANSQQGQQAGAALAGFIGSKFGSQ